MERVYVSHSNSEDDKKYLKLLSDMFIIRKLSKKGSEYFFRKDLLAGDNIKDETFNHIQRANLILIVLSSNYLADNDLQIELENIIAWSKKLNICVILFKARPTDFYEYLKSKDFKFEEYPFEKDTISEYTLDEEKERVIAKFGNFIDKQNLSEALNEEIFTYQVLKEKVEKLTEDQYWELEQLESNSNVYSLFTARDKYLGRKVVIKAIHPWMVKDDTRFKEALVELYETIKQISIFKHRNLKMVYSARFGFDVDVIVQEYVEGIFLTEIINLVDRLPTVEVFRIANKIGDVLIYGHYRGLVHRNVNIDNIIIDEELEPVLSPFKIVNTEEHFDDCAREEFLRYKSPEQIEHKYSDHLSDQYSFGLVLFEMLTGKPLFDSNLANIMKQRQEIYENPALIDLELRACNCCEALISAINKMLSKDPQKRFDSIADALEEFNLINSKDADLHRSNVIQSYYRCCLSNKRLIESFYEHFFTNNPKMKIYFEGMPMEEQYNKLRYSLGLILTLHDNKKNIYFTHARRKHSMKKIGKKEYEEFCKSLIYIVETYDEKIKKHPEIKKSWGYLLNECIDFMTR